MKLLKNKTVEFSLIVSIFGGVMFNQTAFGKTFIVRTQVQVL